MHPTVSVILPMFNCEQYLEQAINSVLQQETALELIMVDDGSTDGSSRIAQNYRDQFELSSSERSEQFHGNTIRYIRQESMGVAAARGTGIDAANGDLLAFIDADDLWTPGKLKRQIDALSDRPEVACAIGKIQMFFDEISGQNSEEETRMNSSPLRTLCGEPYFCYVFGSAVIRRSVFDKVGKMNESMKISSDMEWFVRLREQFRVETMDFISLLYRYRPGSLTAGKSFQERNILSLLKQSLDRRRAESGGAGPLC